MEQTATADPVHNTEHALDATQENLDRVRDILFGAQIREQNHRREEFEQELANRLAAFEEDSRKRLESLELFVKREIASVAAPSGPCAASCWIKANHCAMS